MTEPPPQPPKKTLSEQLTDALIKLLVAGGGGTSLLFLFKNDIPKAAIAAVVAAGAGLLTSFGEGLMKVLKAWMSKRGEQAGNTITKKADRVLDRPLGFQPQYLKALKANCYALEVEGFKGNLPPLALKDIFIRLRLDSDPARTLSPDLIKDIWDLLPKADARHHQPLNLRLAIVADPGYGKTTLTRYLTLSYTDGSYHSQKARELIPLLLLFRTIHSQIQDETTPSLPDLILQQIKRLPRCQHLQPSRQWFEDKLTNGKCLVMLDGLDEVPESQREKVSNWANWQMQAYRTPFLLTSRPHGYDSSLFRGVQQVGILDFTNDQKQEFVEKWYRVITRRQKWDVLWEENQQRTQNERLSREQVEAQIQEEAGKAAADLTKQLFSNIALNELAKNPLLMTIIAATHRAFESLPNRRVNLYRKIFNLLLEDRPNRRETRLTISNAEENQAVLQVLALRLVEQNKIQFTPNQASPWMQARLSECCLNSSLTPAKFLREIQDIAGLLGGGTEEEGLYQFTHKTFQEYLAAIELQEQGQEQTLIEKFYNPDWKEVICFYATLSSATPFVKLALDNPSEDSEVQKYALKLARRLVEEGGKVDSETRQRLEQALEKTDFGEELNAAIRLEQRFRNLTTIDEKTAISEPITWGEYRLFLEAQKAKQFHSKAKILSISTAQETQPVTGISWQDGLWFCAWLATQTNLQSEGVVYDYRLPTEAEELGSRSSLIPLSIPPNPPLEGGKSIPPNPLEGGKSIPFSPPLEGGNMRVVREEIPNRYKNLLNYLANGRWKEADKETGNVMLEVAVQKKRGYLMPDDIDKFPCEDLRIINQLWLKFSGGHFGFSVQKEIYESLGGTRQYNKEVWEKFGDRVGWRKGDDWLNYSDLTFNLELASPAHLPGHWWHGTFREWGHLFSRAKTCGL